MLLRNVTCLDKRFAKHPHEIIRQIGGLPEEDGKDLLSTMEFGFTKILHKLGITSYLAGYAGTCHHHWFSFLSFFPFLFAARNG